jgi:predicted TIM-barrel fold metal-dependent hydrolase
MSRRASFHLSILGVFLCAVGVATAFASPSRPSPSFVDFHNHVFGEYKVQSDATHPQDNYHLFFPGDFESELKAFPQDGNLRLVITPSFMPTHFEFSTEEELSSVNVRVSNAIKAESGRFLGLCGIPLRLDFAMNVARHCLSLPRMVGFKVRFYLIDEIGTSESWKNLEKLVALADEKKTIVLAHFRGGRVDEKGRQWIGDPTQTKLLIDLMATHPNASLVIAHSGIDSFVGLNGLTQIGENYRSHPNLPRNIYLEISQSVMQTFGHGGAKSWEGFEPIIQAWRDFGMDRVLLGSDAPFESDPLIWDTELLTEKEKRLIAIENAKSILGSRVESAQF